MEGAYKWINATFEIEIVVVPMETPNTSTIDVLSIPHLHCID